MEGFHFVRPFFALHLELIQYPVRDDKGILFINQGKYGNLPLFQKGDDLRVQPGQIKDGIPPAGFHKKVRIDYESEILFLPHEGRNLLPRRKGIARKFQKGLYQCKSVSRLVHLAARLTAIQGIGAGWVFNHVNPQPFQMVLYGFRDISLRGRYEVQDKVFCFRVGNFIRDGQNPVSLDFNANILSKEKRLSRLDRPCKPAGLQDLIESGSEIIAAFKLDNPVVTPGGLNKPAHVLRQFTGHIQNDRYAIIQANYRIRRCLEIDLSPGFQGNEVFPGINPVTPHFRENTADIIGFIWYPDRNDSNLFPTFHRFRTLFRLF